MGGSFPKPSSADGPSPNSCRHPSPNSSASDASDALSPGYIACWTLWRHCLCRFGWYPLLVAPLVTCACLLDVCASTGCDFIRMDIGFDPRNDVWGDSRAQLGLFSFDSRERERNKWKRSFHDGCRTYSEAFDASFVGNDQAWRISRIMAYVSGVASLVALATAWLLTVTPLPASFFWPGVLLPAVLLAMLSGAAKFLFFDAEICTEPLWLPATEGAEAVPARSCELGESSVYGIAAVAAHFFCAVLICFRSPRKRRLDEDFGRSERRCAEGAGSTLTPNTAAEHVGDPERGEAVAAATERPRDRGGAGVLERKASSSGNLGDSQQTTKVSNAAATAAAAAAAVSMVIVDDQQRGNRGHTRDPSAAASDLTWSTGSNKHRSPAKDAADAEGGDSNDNFAGDRLGKDSPLRVLSPPRRRKTKSPRNQEPRSVNAKMAQDRAAEDQDDEWDRDYSRPVIVTIEENAGRAGHTIPPPTRKRVFSKDQSLSYSDGSTAQSSSGKSSGQSSGESRNDGGVLLGRGPRGYHVVARPPRHNGGSRGGGSSSGGGNHHHPAPAPLPKFPTLTTPGHTPGRAHGATSHAAPHGDAEGSVASRISKLSLDDRTRTSDDLSALGMASSSALQNPSAQSVASSGKGGAPSVVAIPIVSRRGHRRAAAGGAGSAGASSGASGASPGRHGSAASGASPGRGGVVAGGASPGDRSGSSSRSSSSKRGGRLRYGRRGRAREDRNDVFSVDWNVAQALPLGRVDSSQREGALEYLPPLDEMSASRSLGDHGDLINRCVRDLKKSFGDGGGGEGGGFRTM
ncbi:hypothetical protein ACHAWF_006991 [Thalassiosira exigua]